MTPGSLDPAAERGVTAVKPPTIGDAMSDVMDAGERLVTHRLELAMIEMRKTLENLQQTATLGAGAALLAGTGWIFAMLALFWWLERFASRPLAAAAVGVLQFVLAVTLLKSRARLSGRTR
jgi:hypothetical protein